MNKESPIYKAIIEEFYSISHAARKLGFTRRSIYGLIGTGVISTRAKNKIKNAGYDPVTFKPIAHTQKFEPSL